MKNKTIGEILKEERLLHRIDLDTLSQKTRIRKKYLEALENNDFTILPSTVFIKGYIKKYASIFALDYQSLLAILRRDYKLSNRGKLVPREFIKPIITSRPAWTPITITLITLVSLFITLFSYITIQWYNLNKPPMLKIYSPQDNEVVAAKVIIKGETEPEALVTIDGQPVATTPDGQFEHEIHLPQEGLNSILIQSTNRQGKSTLLSRSIKVKY